MVTNPVYSHDGQHVLIPEGTFLLGDVHKVSGTGQQRLAVTFHRMIMPDGYSVDLDQFHGLNQIGETGLSDQLNVFFYGKGRFHPRPEKGMIVCYSYLNGLIQIRSFHTIMYFTTLNRAFAQTPCKMKQKLQYLL
jgi:hypothetical protein